jgi:hypothetical protein
LGRDFSKTGAPEWKRFCRCRGRSAAAVCLTEFGPAIIRPRILDCTWCLKSGPTSDEGSSVARWIRVANMHKCQVWSSRTLSVRLLLSKQ